MAQGGKPQISNIHISSTINDSSQPPEKPKAFELLQYEANYLQSLNDGLRPQSVSANAF